MVRGISSLTDPERLCNRPTGGRGFQETICKTGFSGLLSIIRLSLQLLMRGISPSHPAIKYGAGSKPISLKQERPGVLSRRLEGDGIFDGAGDEAAAGGLGQQLAQEFAGLGQEAEFEAALQVAGEMGQALKAEAALPHPLGRRFRPILPGSVGVPAFCRLRRWPCRRRIAGPRAGGGRLRLRRRT